MKSDGLQNAGPLTTDPALLPALLALLISSHSCAVWLYARVLCYLALINPPHLGAQTHGGQALQPSQHWGSLCLELAQQALQLPGVLQTPSNAKPSPDHPLGPRP